jgi:hypothetical protein
MSEEIQQQFPSLTTQETQRLRSDYPSIEHLEAGNVAAWLVERQEQLLVRAKDERTGMNLAKLITLAGGTVGAICYATSPLAPIGALVAGVGYIWAVAQDMNDSHQFAPIPFVRGNFIDFLEAMGDKDARVEWFTNQNELVDLMFHLEPFERYEFGMLKEHAHVLSEYLVRVEPGKRFYAYRWLFDWFVNLKGTFPGVEQLTSHLATVTLDPRINYQQVTAIQEYQTQVAAQGIPPTQTAPLPSVRTVSLPQPQFVELPRAVVGENTLLEAIETRSVAQSDEQSAMPINPGVEPANPASSPAFEINDEMPEQKPDVSEEEPKQSDYYQTGVQLYENPSFAAEVVRNLARSPLCKIFGAVPGSGKTTMQRALIKEVATQFPQAQFYITQTKRDSFLGIESIPSAVIFSAPRRDDGEPILNQADRVSRILEYRSSFPASEAKRLFRDKPVILLLCDYSDSIKQSSSEVKTELLKIIQQILFNGRAPNVQVWLDVQVLNLLTALGLDGSDSRSAALLICLGAERVEEGGDFGVVENAITGSSETFPSGFKAKVKPHLEKFKARSRETNRTLAVTPFMDAGAFLLPNWSALEDEKLPDALLLLLEQNLQQQRDLISQIKRRGDIRAELEGLLPKTSQLPGSNPEVLEDAGSSSDSPEALEGEQEVDFPGSIWWRKYYPEAPEAIEEALFVTYKNSLEAEGGKGKFIAEILKAGTGGRKYQAASAYVDYLSKKFGK